MNFKIKFLLIGFFTALNLNNCKASNSPARDMLSAAIAGPALRTLIAENISGSFNSPENSKLQENKKTNINKWSHRVAAILNIYTVWAAANCVFDKRGSNTKDNIIVSLACVLGFFSAMTEREAVNSLKQTKAFKDNKELVDFATPVVLAALQYVITKE